jgi:anthraniloyl-CoA monooxygenase
MRIACIGGGPAGLYFALLMKLADPTHAVTVYERNRPGDTFGWGVVFSDQTLGNLALADPTTHREIEERFIHWDDIDIHYRGRCITAGGQGFSGIRRTVLLDILARRAIDVGVDIRYQHDIAEEAQLSGADLIVACDGANSRIRTTHADAFGPSLESRECRYVWMGTSKKLGAFTFAFEQTAAGWFTLHAYPFDSETSTFIVECRKETLRAAGLEGANVADTTAFCERLFARYLDGHALRCNAAHLASPWVTFVQVRNRSWHHGKIVLLGDAAHTAHFSIGSGTKLAMEDAIALARAISAERVLENAFQAYEQERTVEVLRLQNAARNSMEWFEHVGRYAALDPEQFAYSLLTRSQRISHENLRVRDGSYVAHLESWIADRSRAQRRNAPPMFTPFRLRGLELQNRIVVSPMAMYSCVDGEPNDFYLVHLGSRAQGGAALLFTEMTCVSADARISPGCAGMYKPEHAKAWTRIVDFVHDWTPAKVGLQLGHAGPKGSTQLGWEDGDEPLLEGNWPLVAPSALASGPNNAVPRAMTRADMDRIRDDFVRAAHMGVACGFDLLELHCAHGYLLSSFITPLSNHRRDEYGGSLENRLRYPLEVFSAIRTVWPDDKPMSVRISATDWVDGGITGADSVEIARAFKTAGADLIDVSAGQTSRLAAPVYGRMFQTPYSDRIRNEVGIATMAVGNIFEPDHANGIIAAGRADLCALARPHLADPYWTLHAAAQLGYEPVDWPKQYLQGKAQYIRNLQRAMQAQAQAQAAQS